VSPKDRRSIAVIAEHLEGRLTQGTADAFALGMRLGDLVGGDVQVFLAGDQVETLGSELCASLGVNVVAVRIPGLSPCHGEALMAPIVEVLGGWNPGFVCLPHSSLGWEVAPGLAMQLGAACITAVEGVSMERGGPVFRRSMHGGKIVAGVRAGTGTVVLTAQPGAFKRPEGSPRGPGRLEIRERPYPQCRSRSLGQKPGIARDSAVSQAEIVVAAGRGVGKEENLALVHRLALAFANAAVGASRPLCDLGWISYRHQVGLTGATVAPRLYIACGISGAYQHIVGMRESGFIVAVNTDPHAAIFNVADICIQEDLTVFIPAFLMRLSDP
jgi:electron transfer flavoprotein alpha subunit